jgi:hypothetical protein
VGNGKWIALLLLLLILAPRDAGAQVVISREGAENPAVSITKSIFWGGLGGLILGGAIALVAEDNEGDIIKWSFVGGTAAGLAVGIWHVATRPQPSSALLDVGPEKTRVALPRATWERLRDPLGADGKTDSEVRLALVTLHR